MREISGHMQVKGDVKVTVMIHEVTCNTADAETAADDIECEAQDLVGSGLDSNDVKDYEILSVEAVQRTISITGYDDPPDREDR